MTKAVVASFSTIGVLTTAYWLADGAIAQGKKDDAFGADVSSQCAQMTSAQVKDECVRRLRGESQIGYRTFVARWRVRQQLKSRPAGICD